MTLAAGPYPGQHLPLQPAIAAVGAVIKQAPVAKPAKANSPIPKLNIRICFMAITYAELAMVVSLPWDPV